MAQRNTGPPPGEALPLGALAGAAAVWVMDRVDWFNYRHAIDTPETRRRTGAVRPGGMDPAHVAAAEGARLLGLRARLERVSWPLRRALSGDACQALDDFLAQKRSSRRLAIAQ